MEGHELIQKLLSLIRTNHKEKENPAILVETPKYFEVWGEAVNSSRRLAGMFWAMLAVVGLLLLILSAVIRRPPVVIRVDKVGQAEAIGAYAATHEIAKVEVIAFTKLFLEFYTKKNGYTIASDMEHAASMMTPKMRESADVEAIVMATTEGKVKTELTLTEIEVAKTTPENIVLSVKGWRAISTYEPTSTSAPREEVFQGELILEKTPRTSGSPYGLLAESYTESLFKK